MVTQTSLSNLQPNIEEIILVITKSMIGEICHQVTFSYGDELQLDFGEMSAYTHPKLAHLYKGSWQFCTRATSWILKQKEQVLTDSLQVNIDAERYKPQIDALKEVLRQLENKKLINLAFVTNNMGLTLVFEEDYELILEPDLQDDSGLTYWELFMPTQQLLTVGPGLFWECKSIYERY